MENNESFASPKEEAPIINKLEETIVEWLKSGDENATNLAYQIFFKHIERKEPSSKRPDFEKMARKFVGQHVRPGKGYIGEVIFENMIPGIVAHTRRTMEYMHELYVLPSEEKIKHLEKLVCNERDIILSLEQEIERLREELKSKLKEVKRIRITKLKEAENPVHPNNISEGFTLDGDFIAPPTIGERFYVGINWSTSLVQEIISHDTFRTFNSIYRIEPID